MESPDISVLANLIINLLAKLVSDSPLATWRAVSANPGYDLKQIATEFFSAGMHSGEVSLKHTKNPLRHLWGKQVKSAIKVTFSN